MHHLLERATGELVVCSEVRGVVGKVIMPLIRIALMNVSLDSRYA